MAVLTEIRPSRKAKAPIPWNQLWTVDGDELRVSMHAGQEQAWTSTARFIAVIAGSQSGKTSWGPLWLHREILDKGPGDYLAVTATFPLLKLKMLTEFLKLFDETLHLGTWHGGDKVFVFHDKQTRVIFGSATHPNSLESATAKAAWLDEAGQDEFRLGSWEALLRRLALNQGRALLTTTPYNLGWLKQQVYDRWRAGDPNYQVVQFPSVTNPAFPLAEDERAKRTLPSWKYAMFYRGQFDRPAGLIYNDFLDAYREDGGHKIHAFIIPPEWPRYGGLDFGANNTARVLIAQDPQAKVFYLYADSLTGGKTTGEHARNALAAVDDAKSETTWYGGAKSETQQRMDWRAQEVYVGEPMIPDVEAGIDRVIALFKERRLYVFDSCGGTLDQLGSYSRVVDEMGEPTEAIKAKETYHYLDALRYIAPALTTSSLIAFGTGLDD